MISSMINLTTPLPLLSVSRSRPLPLNRTWQIEMSHWHGHTHGSECGHFDSHGPGHAAVNIPVPGSFSTASRPSRLQRLSRSITLPFDMRDCGVHLVIAAFFCTAFEFNSYAIALVSYIIISTAFVLGLYHLFCQMPMQFAPQKAAASLLPSAISLLLAAAIFGFPVPPGLQRTSLAESTFGADRAVVLNIAVPRTVLGDDVGVGPSFQSADSFDWLSPGYVLGIVGLWRSQGVSSVWLEVPVTLMKDDAVIDSKFVSLAQKIRQTGVDVVPLLPLLDGVGMDSATGAACSWPAYADFQSALRLAKTIAPKATLVHFGGHIVASNIATRCAGDATALMVALQAASNASKLSSVSPMFWDDLLVAPAELGERSPAHKIAQKWLTLLSSGDVVPVSRPSLSDGYSLTLSIVANSELMFEAVPVVKRMHPSRRFRQARSVWLSSSYGEPGAGGCSAWSHILGAAASVAGWLPATESAASVREPNVRGLVLVSDSRCRHLALLPGALPAVTVQLAVGARGKNDPHVRRRALAQLSTQVSTKEASSEGDIAAAVGTSNLSLRGWSVTKLLGQLRFVLDGAVPSRQAEILRLGQRLQHAMKQVFDNHSSSIADGAIAIFAKQIRTEAK